MRCMRCYYLNPKGSKLCVKCGYELYKTKIFLAVAIVAVIVGTLLSFVKLGDNHKPVTKTPVVNTYSQKEPEPPIESIAVAVDYIDVCRYPDKYKGKAITFTGTVIQVSEGIFDSVIYRVEDYDGNIWYVTYIHSEGECRILQNDIVTCYGECTGLETYTAVFGNTITIPSVRMKSYSIDN